jgi:hypothetical protein
MGIGYSGSFGNASAFRFHGTTADLQSAPNYLQIPAVEE